MKRNLLLLAALFTMSLTYSQFYAGLSGGYSFGATQRVNGTEVKLNGSSMSTSVIYGSYGEGMSGNLKLGYFFNDHLGAELNLGYLHGSDQTKADVSMPAYGMETDAVAHSRVFRSTLSLVYKINNGLYGRFGAYFPLGGKTVVNTTDRRAVDGIPIRHPETGEVIGYGVANVATEYEMEIHGTPTIGFAGAIYAHMIGFISPPNFSFDVSLLIVAMVILGGMDNIVGVIIGTLILSILPEKMRVITEYRILIYGILLIVIPMFRPKGLLPFKPRKYHSSIVGS